MTLIHPHTAISCHPTSGPTFGYSDLHICDECDAISDSFANFPSSYNFDSKPYAHNSQVSWSAFSGTTEDN